GLFEPFSQADSSTTRSYGGTGLGLAISDQLVGLMGGTLELQSEIGRGSTFSFTVRMVKPTEPITALIKRSDLTGVRTLIVDDNATNRTILERQTRSWGMVSESAASGNEGLRMLREAVADRRPYQLGLLDMDMPDMNGIAMANAVISDRALKTLPLVLLTSSTRETSESIRVAGFAASLTKPVRQSHLYDAIMTSLGSRPLGPTARARKADTFTATISPGRRPRLLVAEDNAVNQKVAVAMLAKLGFQADVAANGAEAIEALSRIPYQAVLMDCQMPVMDGYDATTAIRKSEDNATHVPIIAMTASALDGERDRCLAAGMDDYLTKPVAIAELEATLARWTAPVSPATAGRASSPDPLEAARPNPRAALTST
ncbi:MAG TPA: response regulator, partial [Actinomycetota bacterium]|nr:response regulator [Actinomycetota bacterium]